MAPELILRVGKRSGLMAARTPIGGGEPVWTFRPAGWPMIWYLPRWRTRDEAAEIFLAFLGGYSQALSI